MNEVTRAKSVTRTSRSGERRPTDLPYGQERRFGRWLLLHRTTLDGLSTSFWTVFRHLEAFHNTIWVVSGAGTRRKSYTRASFPSNRGRRLYVLVLVGVLASIPDVNLNVDVHRWLQLNRQPQPTTRIFSEARSRQQKCLFCCEHLL